jgi:hypothetical protein
VEAAIPLPALGVEDPELHPSTRRSVAAAGDERLRALADDVAAQPDPARPRQLEPEAGGFRDRGREAGREARGFERDEERLRPASERRKAPQPVGDLRRRRADARPRREVDHENIDRSGGQQHPGDREALVEGVRRQHDEPIEVNASRDGLHRVERAGEIQPGDDRPVRLSLRDEPEGEGRRARGRRTAQRDARVPRQAARADDCVELRKARPDDRLDASSRLARRGRDGNELRGVVERLRRERRRGQCPDHPRSCGAPPRLERRQSRRHVRGEAGHRTSSIEHLFGIVNGSDCRQSLRVRPATRATPPRRARRRSPPAPATGSVGDAHPSRRPRP